MKLLFIAALMVALGSNAIAQTAGGGAGAGASSTGSASGSGVTAGTPAAGTTQGALSAPAAPSGTLNAQQPASALGNPTADGAIRGGVSANPAPGGINQRVTVGNPPTTPPIVTAPQVAPLDGGNQAGSPVGGINNQGVGVSALPQAQPVVPGGLGANPSAAGTPGLGVNAGLTPVQTQQMELLSVQLNALRGTANAAQSVPAIEAGLRQLGGANTQFPAGSLTRLSTGLANAWQNSNLTAAQQQQILTSVASVISAQGNPASAQQALVVARQRLTASGLPNTTVMALNNELQQLLVAQRGAQGAAAPGQTGVGTTVTPGVNR